MLKISNILEHGVLDHIHIRTLDNFNNETDRVNVYILGNSEKTNGIDRNI